MSSRMIENALLFALGAAFIAAGCLIMAHVTILGMILLAPGIAGIVTAGVRTVVLLRRKDPW